MTTNILTNNKTKILLALDYLSISIEDTSKSNLSDCIELDDMLHNKHIYDELREFKSDAWILEKVHNRQIDARLIINLKLSQRDEYLTKERAYNICKSLLNTIYLEALNIYGDFNVS